MQRPGGALHPHTRVLYQCRFLRIDNPLKLTGPTTRAVVPAVLFSTVRVYV